MNSSSVLFVFCILAVASRSTFGEHHEKFHAARDKCMKEFGVDDEAVKSHMMGESDEPNMKCFGACIMKEMETMREDGTVDVDKSVAMVPEKMEHRDKLIENIKTCFVESGDEKCETANKIHACMRDHFKHEKH